MQETCLLLQCHRKQTLFFVFYISCSAHTACQQIRIFSKDENIGDLCANKTMFDNTIWAKSSVVIIVTHSRTFVRSIEFSCLAMGAVCHREVASGLAGQGGDLITTDHRYRIKGGGGVECNRAE